VACVPVEVHGRETPAYSETFHNPDFAVENEAVYGKIAAVR
jgi:hypothetical protein